MTKTQLDRAKEIHEKSIVIDGSEVLALDPVAFDRRRKGGITALNATVPDNLYADPIEAYREVCEHIDFVEYCEDRALLVTTADDIRKAKKDGKCGVILGPQNGSPLVMTVDDVAFLKWAGIRIIQITYNKRNFIGDGCAERTNAGLSDFGVEVVEEMNRQGIVVDLSHCGDQTTLEAIEFSKNPCVFSHASVRTISPQVRNKSDEAIQALAEKDGVMAICSWGPLIRVGDNPPKIEDVYAHVKYVEDLVGIDHVALATDVDERLQPPYMKHMAFQTISINKLMVDYMKLPPPEVRSKWPLIPGGYGAEGFQDFTKVLVAGGYSDQEIRKILGENLMRVFERVWGK
jgi:membrane dipeptidase